MLFNLKQNSFGLDISERALRLVLLKKHKQKAKVVSIGVENLPAGVIDNGKILDSKKFTAHVKNLIKNVKGQRISIKYVNTGLPEPQTFIKLISLTYPNSKNILKEIISESKKHIPYPLEKTYFDWQFVNNKDRSKVLIAVCPKDIVDNYQENIIKAGLIPIVLEIEAVAICRSLIALKNPNPEPFIILDLGATRTSLIIYQGYTILYSLSFEFCADKLNKIIKSKLNLSFEEIEKSKKLCGLDPKKAGGGIKKLIEPQVKKLAQQIRESKYFYHEHYSKEKEIKTLILTGGTSQMPHLAEYLSEQCKLKTEISNPLLNLSDHNSDLFPKDIQSYTTAIGLALRNIQEL